MYGGVIPFD